MRTTCTRASGGSSARSPSSSCRPRRARANNGRFRGSLRHGAVLAALSFSGCAYHVNWPAGPVETRTRDDGVVERWYAPDGRPAGSYRQVVRGGRVEAVSFDDDGDGVVDETVELTGERRGLPHFVIVLDGVPFDLVEAMHKEGRFALFAPPVRVVSVFPAMTDLALARIFRTKPCVAAEALYFDRATNALSSGNDVYLSGANAPWKEAVAYSAPQDVAVNTYLNPPSVFSRELRDMHRCFNAASSGTVAAYSVGTAGLGTRGGGPAIRDYLTEIEKLCERITYDRRGRVRFSVLADHGHGLLRCERVDFADTLAAAGFRKARSIRGPDDVVEISYGLVTYAQFHTDRPADVAAVLVGHPAVDLAAYRDGDAVVVRNATATARITRREDGHTYETSAGDPLDLARIVSALRDSGHVTADGVIADRPLLEATAAHKYPDPLHRLWSCLYDLTDKPADVIVSLRPQFCHGSAFFHFFIAPVASTHGALDYRSSVTFLLTNAVGERLPDVIRVDDVADVLGLPAAARIDPVSAGR